MALDYTFICPLPNGMHARPASALEEIARGFAADVVLTNQRNGRHGSAKSILALVGIDLRFQDPCRLTVSGKDQEPAMAALGKFVRVELSRCDAPLPVVSAPAGELKLPPVLRSAATVAYRGAAVVPGIGQGWLVKAGGFRIHSGLPLEGAQNPQAEQRKIDHAIEQLVAWYEHEMVSAGRGIEREMFSAHRSLARDQEFYQLLADAIVLRGRTAAGAIAEAVAHFSARLQASENILLRERSLDLQDVCSQLLGRIYGRAAEPEKLLLTEDSVVLAEALTPGQFLALDRRYLKGLVLSQAGTTSHTIILARSFGIPTLVGVAGLSSLGRERQEVIVDGDLGALVTQLTESGRRYYAMERNRLEGRQRAMKRFMDAPAQSGDGHRLEVCANIGTTAEAEPGFAAGAEGIGLFRTEMLFLDRDEAPGETEQYEVYRRVLEVAGGRPVIIRTLDLGGDKPLPYLQLPPEANPFLGYRAVRIYPEFENLFRVQLRALLRASAHGKLKLMLPMVASVEEVRWARRILREEQARCEADKLACDPALALGAMIEVPAAAFSLVALAQEVDFFSIGSNDLLQYWMAADRGNGRLNRLYDPLQPSFLRLLRQIIEDAHALKKWVGLCGEMGGQLDLLPLLVGLGLDEVSLGAPGIPEFKARLAQVTLPECCQLFAAAARCVTPAEVRRLLEQFQTRHSAPVFSPELLLVDVDAHSKEEAIKSAVDLLYVEGRVKAPRLVEEAVLLRESTYSTGFGYGFAIPHCRCDSVCSNSLVVVNLREAVNWGAADGQPVKTLALLAMRETDNAAEHMRVFAALARQVMHEDFRERLQQERDGTALCAFFKERLKL